jgi:hypothetical protein
LAIGLALLRSDLIRAFSSTVHRWRIFFDYGVATSVAPSSSGFVPEDGSNGDAGESGTVGFELDRVSTHLCRVLSAKNRDLVVILLFLEALYVTLLPPMT